MITFINRRLLVIAIGILCISTVNTQAFVWSAGGEKLSLAQELPDTEEWLAENGTALDIYVLYKEFWILWVPLWNYDARYVLSGSGGKDAFFYDFVDSSEEAQIKTEYGLGSPESAIPFWNRFGGKLLLAVIILGWIKSKYGSSTEDSVTHVEPFSPGESQDPNESIPLEKDTADSKFDN